MDQELFELCKAVYEKTGWKEHPWIMKFPDANQEGVRPFYSSDYLLEKLKNKAVSVQKTLNTKDGWWASDNLSDKVTEHQKADTPLKALLKLTLALHEAGELK